MTKATAEIVREYGPFPNVASVGGVTYDGRHVWFAGGGKMNEIDPTTGDAVRTLDVPADAGTAFDGEHLYQLADGRIRKVDPRTGAVIATIDAPAGGGHSGPRGLRGRSGSGSTATGRSVRWIRKPGPCSAASSRTASSRE